MDTPRRFAIRPARPGDEAVVFDFVAALARFERLEGEVIVAGAVARLREHLFGAAPACEVLLAERDGRAIGFALFFPIYSTFKTERCLHLEDLFVIPEERGNGAGEALLRAVAGVAHARGHARLQWCVLDWNEAAIRFYRRLGANVRPDWRVCQVEGNAAIGRLACGSDPANETHVRGR